MDDRGDAQNGEEEPEDDETPFQPEDLDRSQKQGRDEDSAEKRPEKERGGVEPAERPAPARRREGQGEAQEKGRRQRVGEEEEDPGDKVQYPPPDPVPIPADHHGRREGQGQPEEDPRSAVVGPEEQDEEPDEEPGQPCQQVDGGKSPPDVVAPERQADGHVAAVFPEDELDRIADPVAGGDEIEIVFDVADLEAVDPDGG